VDRPRLQRIAREHLANDSPVVEYFWQGPLGLSRPFKKPPTGFRPPATPGYDSPKPRQEQKARPKKTYEVDDFKW
jgi:hypothetical protein